MDLVFDSSKHPETFTDHDGVIHFLISPKNEKVYKHNMTVLPYPLKPSLCRLLQDFSFEMSKGASLSLNLPQ